MGSWGTIPSLLIPFSLPRARGVYTVPVSDTNNIV